MNQQQSYQQHHLHNQHLFNDSTIIVARKLTTIHVFEHIFTTQVSPTARTHSFSPHSIGLRFGLQSYYATKNNNHNHSNTNKIKKAVTSKILLLAAGSDSSCNHHNHNHQNQLNTARSSNDRTLPFHGKNADSFPARATNLNNSHMKLSDNASTQEIAEHIYRLSPNTIAPYATTVLLTGQSDKIQQRIKSIYRQIHVQVHPQSLKI